MAHSNNASNIPERPIASDEDPRFYQIRSCLHDLIKLKEHVPCHQTEIHYELHRARILFTDTQLPGQLQLFPPRLYSMIRVHNIAKQSNHNRSLMIGHGFISAQFCCRSTGVISLLGGQLAPGRFEHISMEVHLHSPSHQKWQREPIMRVTSSLCDLSVGIASTVAMKRYQAA